MGLANVDNLYGFARRSHCCQFMHVDSQNAGWDSMFVVREGGEGAERIQHCSWEMDSEQLAQMSDERSVQRRSCVRVSLLVLKFLALCDCSLIVYLSCSSL